MFEKNFLKRSSWTDLIISVIVTLIGALLIVKPEETVGAISVVLGLLFIIMGSLKLIEYYTSDNKDDYLLTVALLAVIFGVIILFASNSILSLFRVILGAWVIIAGVMDLETVLMWKKVKSPYWTASLLFSILMIFAGIIILVRTNILLTTLGIFVVIYGVLDIINRLVFITKINDNEKKD